MAETAVRLETARFIAPLAAAEAATAETAVPATGVAAEEEAMVHEAGTDRQDLWVIPAAAAVAVATAAEVAAMAAQTAEAAVAAMVLVVKVLLEEPGLMKLMTSQDQAVTAAAVEEAEIMAVNMAATAVPASASSSITSKNPHNRKETTP